LLWGVVGPLLVAGLVVVIGPAGLLAAVIYPAQMARLALRGGLAWGVFSVLGKFAEAQGALGYYGQRLRGGQKRLIEYK
jgi:acyl-CoA reductase-like NAD-dependent aldehyde dehydrogenase